jgi:hypothetical protein
VKLPTHSAGLPGKEILFILCPLTPPCGTKAGNLASGIAFVEIMVCPLGQFIQTCFQKTPFLLEMGSIPVLIDLNRFSPDEYAFGEGIGK